MLHQLQLLFDVLGHRLIEFAGKMCALPEATLLNNMDDNAPWDSFGDGVLALERLHWVPVMGILLGAASFVGFLLLVRYLQSATRPRPNRSAPQLLASPDLPVADIFVSVATAIIGLAVCWAIS